jgi:dihydropyrimidine dehydrogenase (NAD+) subunit PreT
MAPDVTPGRLPKDRYAENFADLHPPLDTHQALVAAERCLFCYDAPCVSACPTGIDIPLFIRQISTGTPLAAAKTILDANILGGMCARVCPTETLCEEVCVREISEGKAVTIGLLQRHATDALMTSGRQIYGQGTPSGKRVAVVGAGPAGLSCAHRLATLGHEVTIFEARNKGGGLNEFGIAAYKTVGGFAQREIDYVLGVGGITLKTGEELGRSITLDRLQQSFDAVFLGVGLGAVNALGLDGEDLAGVEDAIDYIARLRQTADLSTLPVGRRVVVIGGGMTAIDIASQAKRLGAEEVTIVYRRGQEAMNASLYEQQVAQTDGVLIRHWLKPVSIAGTAGHVSAVTFEYTREAEGRLVGTGETLTLPCDQLFKAIGQALAPEGASGLEREAGRLKVDADGRTSRGGVWAGGDCVAGGSDLTVVAVEDGKRAALSIHQALTAASVPASERG